MKKIEVSYSDFRFRDVCSHVGYTPVTYFGKFANPARVEKTIMERIKAAGFDTLEQCYAEVERKRKEAQKAAEKRKKEEDRKAKEYRAISDTLFDGKGVVLTKANCCHIEKFILNHVVKFDGAGDHDVYIPFDKKFDYYVETSNNWNVYSKRTKYPCREYTAHVGIPLGKQIFYIGGLLTVVVGKYDYRNGCKVMTLMHRRGYDFEWEQHFLVRGYHSMKPTIEKAREEEYNNRRNRVLNAWKKHNEKERNILQLLMEKGDKNVCLEDSLRAGNCRPGSMSFCSRHNLDAESTIKLKALWDIASPDEKFYIERILRIL